MHHVEGTAAGFRGAENGTVAIYVRGSEGTFAGYYTTFEADQGLTTPTAPLNLDANGRPSVGTIYVNQLVDCVVKDSSGATVCEFVSGVNASAVECITDSFTGTDYGTGQAGSSKPITLQEILDKWDGSAGADDFKVLVGAASRTLASAFTAFEAVYNVQDPTYGAVGDGSANDTTAINAAITACALTGGTVYFPPGTYRITSTLVVTHSATKTVNLRGAGQTTTTIRMDSNASDAIRSTSTGTTVWSISDLTVILGVATAFDILDLSDSTLALTRCTIGSTTFGSNAVARVAATATLIALACNFAAPGVYILDAPGRVALLGCMFTCGAGGGGEGAFVFFNLTGQSLFLFCTFVATGIISGTNGAILAPLTGGPHVLAGNNFGPTGGGTPYPWSNPTGVTSSDMYDFGNKVGAGYNAPVGFWQVIASGAAHAGTWSATRQARWNTVIDNTAALSLRTQEAATYQVRRTVAGAQTVSPTVPPSAGLEFVIVYNNDQAVAVTLSLSNIRAGAGEGGPYTVNGNRMTVLLFRSIEVAATGGGAGQFYWMLVKALENLTI